MAIRSQGTLVQVGQATDGTTTHLLDVFDTIAEVAGVTGPDGEADEIETTHLGSAAKEFLLGLPDEGNVALSINLVPADLGQVNCRTARDNGYVKNFRITLSDGTTIEFKGLVKRIGPSMQPNSKVDGEITIKVTAAATWVAA